MNYEYILSYEKISNRERILEAVKDSIVSARNKNVFFFVVIQKWIKLIFCCLNRLICVKNVTFDKERSVSVITKQKLSNDNI